MVLCPPRTGSVELVHVGHDGPRGQAEEEKQSAHGVARAQARVQADSEARGKPPLMPRPGVTKSFSSLNLLPACET